MLELDKIYCGDCVHIMRDMPDEFIDLTVTSPPYGELRDYEGYVFDFENIAKELYRITKDGGVVVWVVNDQVVGVVNRASHSGRLCISRILVSGYMIQ